MPRVWFTDDENRTYRVEDVARYTYRYGVADSKAKRELTQHLANEATPVPSGWDVTYDFQPLEEEAPTQTQPQPQPQPTPRPRSCPVPEPRRLQYTRTRIAYKPRI